MCSTSMFVGVRGLLFGEGITKRLVAGGTCSPSVIQLPDLCWTT